MQTLFEALTAQAIRLEAANEEFTPAEAQRAESLRDDTTGWDPYEVWRVRIKDVQDTKQSQPASQ